MSVRSDQERKVTHAATARVLSRWTLLEGYCLWDATGGTEGYKGQTLWIRPERPRTITSSGPCNSVRNSQIR